MKHGFNVIGIIGREYTPGTVDTVLALIQFLKTKNRHVLIDEETAKTLPTNTVPFVDRQVLLQQSELLIVVGGDGSMLTAALTALDNNVPILGVNRGRVGFLTDIHPNEVEYKIGAVLEGHFIEEQRFLITGSIYIQDEVIHQEDALNDIVLQPAGVTQLIEFSIEINDTFVCTHRADGLIVATPTGSTAYALSGGGPILHPSLDALVLVPMFPHTLSSRPLVTKADASIAISVATHNTTTPYVSWDGRRRFEAPPGSVIRICKKKTPLKLIHPTDYNYFETLRTKLHWTTFY